MHNKLAPTGNNFPRITTLGRLVVLAAVVLYTLWLVPSAQAHANLIQSDPEAGSLLSTAPQEITLEFSEDIDVNFSNARLVDGNFQILAQGPGTIDPRAPRVMKFPIPALSNGVYTITWQARSAVDGHVTNGSVGFAIGTAASQVSLLPPPGTPNPTTALPPPIDTILRWLSYLAASVSVGSLFFGYFVWRPAFRSRETPALTIDQQAAKRIKQLAISGSLGLLLISSILIVFQAWQSTQGSFPLPLGSALLKMVDPRSAGLFWFRLVILGMMVLLVSSLPNPGEGPSRPWWPVMILSGGLLLTFSLQGHGAAAGSPLAVVLDWAHLAAMAAWLGGLLPLFLMIQSKALPAAVLIPRFSRVALVSVAALVLSGLYSAYLHVGTLEGLISTLYGRSLIVKSILFGILILLGAINLWVRSPHLGEPQGNAAHHLKTTVQIELALGLLVLLAAGLMMGTSPTKEALLVQQRQGYVGAYGENGVRMALWVAPARAGDNEIAVDISREAPPDEKDPAEVLVRFQMPEDEMDMGITQVKAETQDGHRYTVRGSYLSMAGPWQIEIILRQSGFNDVRHAFNLQVQPALQESTRPNPVPADAASIASGQALYQEYCLPCHGPKGKGDGPAGLALNPHPADLTLHTVPGVHTDGQLYEWISGGYPGSAMPAFERNLTEEQRWSLVNFIRTLAPQNNSPSP